MIISLWMVRVISDGLVTSQKWFESVACRPSYEDRSWDSQSTNNDGCEFVCFQIVKIVSNQSAILKNPDREFFFNFHRMWVITRAFDKNYKQLCVPPLQGVKNGKNWKKIDFFTIWWTNRKKKKKKWNRENFCNNFPVSEN